MSTKVIELIKLLKSRVFVSHKTSASLRMLYLFVHLFSFLFRPGLFQTLINHIRCVSCRSSKAENMQMYLCL